MSGSLTIELRGLADRPFLRADGVMPPASLWSETELRFAEPPRVSFTARAVGGGGIQVYGELRALVRLACRRCLAARREPLVVPLEFHLEPGLEAGSEDEGVYPLRPDGDVVDIGPVVREELLLAVPAFPLCRPDCQGLCARCGADLNDGACGCQAAELDPRWEALKKLRA